MGSLRSLYALSILEVLEVLVLRNNSVSLTASYSAGVLASWLLLTVLDAAP